MVGPIGVDFANEGAELMAGPHDAGAGDVAGRMIALGGIYCVYAEMFVDGSGRALAVAPINPSIRADIEAYLLGRGLSRSTEGDIVVLRKAAPLSEFPSPVSLHMLRNDSWIFTSNNWGGQQPQPYRQAEAWADQLALRAYAGS